MKLSVHKNVFLRSSKTERSFGDIWFIHGFGESGLSFIEAFDSLLAKAFNLFVPDLPGFGVSPLEGDALDQRQTADQLFGMIKSLSRKQSLFFVGHSQGGLIATWLCKRFGSQAKAYANVEGNLTRSDVTFSGEVAAKNHPKECKKHILGFIRDHAGQEESFWRYYASLCFASPNALLRWARAGVAYTGETQAGDEYASLTTPSLYLWGRKSCPEQTKEFLTLRKLNNRGFERSHHWPMIDEPELFYNVVNEFFRGNL